ncbi:DNA repair protein RecO [Sinobacterium norvegicum]|uniref:DNA repair protein RecO n=1 Tax=Sinobacterium norvegicum TaxID=1641715 RepID=A0ABM9AB38_9GAMM|nr:DNA repair protein RecO [Sinobacterium norvegicum]CAH0990412.1 DNA repair protein RecO [Sinobacterium norvegicum]
MMNQVEFDRCYILHTYPFQDHSVIADFISHDNGRQRAVVKNLRNSKKNSTRAILQPLTLLQLSWRGKSDLKTVTSVEAAGKRYSLKGTRLFSAFYLNEILMRTLPVGEVVIEIFEAYEQALHLLEGEGSLEFILRRFEFKLLFCLGYGIDFEQDISAQPIAIESFYRLDIGRGFIPVAAEQQQTFSGQHILAISAGDFGVNNPAIASTTKQLTRLLLSPHLGSEPLKSRALFTAQSGPG